MPEMIRVKAVDPSGREHIQEVRGPVDTCCCLFARKMSHEPWQAYQWLREDRLAPVVLGSKHFARAFGYAADKHVAKAVEVDPDYQTERTK